MDSFEEDDFNEQQDGQEIIDDAEEPMSEDEMDGDNLEIQDDSIQHEFGHAEEGQESHFNFEDDSIQGFFDHRGK